MLWTKVTPKDAQEDATFRRYETIFEIPDAVVYLASVASILFVDMGFSKSVERRTGMLGDETAIPMMSYGLIEYLMGIDLSSFEVLEIGGGNSTHFWAERSKSVLTLETDHAWAQILQARAHPNVTVQTTDAKKLTSDLANLGRTFDIIVIDPAANRYSCARSVTRMLRPGGFILLDNSDWYPNTARLLRDADLIQVDYHDLRPCHHFRCTASLFLHPAFRPRAKYDRMPLQPIGGKNMAPINVWDSPS